MCGVRLALRFELVVGKRPVYCLWVRANVKFRTEAKVMGSNRIGPVLSLGLGLESALG